MSLIVQNQCPSSIISELETQSQLIERIMKLPHYQKMGMDGVSLIVAKARSLNIDPLYALNGALYNVKGKIGMGAETMASMIREKGHSITKDPKSSKELCILHGKRADNGDTWTISFSIQDAQRAGIYGDTWKKYPDIMCYNRAMAFLARQLFPDIIKGCGYTLEELHEIANKHENFPVQQVKEVAFEEVKPEILTVTKEQAQELQMLLENCSVDYQTKVLRSLPTMKPSIETLDQLPVTFYQRFKDRFTAESISYQESLKSPVEVAINE